MKICLRNAVLLVVSSLLLFRWAFWESERTKQLNEVVDIVAGWYKGGRKATSARLGNQNKKTGRCEYNCDDEWLAEGISHIVKQQSDIEKDKMVGSVILQYLETAGTVIRSTNGCHGKPIRVVGVGTSFPLRIASICEKIPCCKMVAAIEPSKRALEAGKLMMDRILPTVAYLPEVKTIADCTADKCLVKEMGTFDLLTVVQILQHVSREDYPRIFTNIHNLIAAGRGTLVESHYAGFPRYSDPSTYRVAHGMGNVSPMMMSYKRMQNCLNAEVFGMWFVLTGRYTYKAMKCDGYGDSVYDWYASDSPMQAQNTERTKSNIFDVLRWYTAQVVRTPLSWEVPGFKERTNLAFSKEDVQKNKNAEKRIDLSIDGKYDALYAVRCTSVLKKRSLDETKQLPPFKEQITELLEKLGTPGWKGKCGFENT
jgi:hypothetical protein